MEQIRSTTSESTNRAAMAFDIANAVEFFAVLHVGFGTAQDIAAKADSKDWQLFAKMARPGSVREKYVPSDDTRNLVRRILSDRAEQAAKVAALPDQPKLCIDCRIRPATRAAGKSGRSGSDFCDSCWSQEFADLDPEAGS